MRKLNKKKITVVTCVALLVIFGITMFAVGGAQSEDVSADIATVTVDGKEITVDKDGNEVKVNKDGKVEVVEENVVSKEEATKAVKESNKNNSNKSNTSNSSSTKPSSNSSNSTKPSSNSSSTTKPTEPVKPTEPAKPSKPTEPTKPSHTHDWVAVYATKQVQVGTEYKWVGSVNICNGCGARNPNVAHLRDHRANGIDTSTHTEEVYENVPIYETQQYIDYYKCSCGATK